MPKVLGGSLGGGRLLMGEAFLYLYWFDLSDLVHQGWAPKPGTPNPTAKRILQMATCDADQYHLSTGRRH